MFLRNGGLYYDVRRDPVPSSRGLQSPGPLPGQHSAGRPGAGRRRGGHQADPAGGGAHFIPKRRPGPHSPVPPLRPVRCAVAAAGPCAPGVHGGGAHLYHRPSERGRPGRLPGPSEHPVQPGWGHHAAGVQALHHRRLCGDRLGVRHRVHDRHVLQHPDHRGEQGDLHPQQPALLRHHHQLHPIGPAAHGDHRQRLLPGQGGGCEGRPG